MQTEQKGPVYPAEHCESNPPLLIKLIKLLIKIKKIKKTGNCHNFLSSHKL